MEVIGNHVEAFYMKFYRIASFDRVAHLMCQDRYKYEYYESERVKNKFVKISELISKLIKEKIRQ